MRAAMVFSVFAVLLLATATGRAEVITQRIEYRDGDLVLEGVLAFDDAVPEGERRPGVLVCHEWWGMNAYSESRAKMLAELGYVAFALDMYGKGQITDDPNQAGAWAGEVNSDVTKMRARAALGLKLLAEQAGVDATRLAAIGYCMGGRVALELARSGLPHSEHLRAIVPFHASVVSASGADEDIAKANANIKGAVLVCHGAIDPFVQEGELETFQQQMEAAKVDYQVVSYAGTVHSFTNAAVDAYKIPGAAYNRAADQRSWAHMLRLFAEVMPLPEQR